MTELEKLFHLQRAATAHYEASEKKEGIDVQSQLIEQIMQLGPAEVKSQPRLKRFLQDVSNQLVDALRWEGLYESAIALQERLVDFFPESMDVLQLAAANLRIENGQEEVGLANIRQLIEHDPGNLWIWTNLGAGYLWLNRYSEAEEAFQHAVGISTASKVDRAIAYQYLFNLYSAQEGQAKKAQAAWVEGCRLDPKMKEMLPEVIRMLIYWREYAEAAQLVPQERDRVRKLFYQGLVIGEHGNYKEASGHWRSILLEIPFEGLKAGQDEYAEACIRLLNPSTAIPILEPLIQANQVTYFRLVILGLAWAQKQSTDRAAWYLSHALRIGDLMRPRKTRPAPQGRILDIQARLLYSDVIINANVRAELDRFFMPILTPKRQVEG
jgi:tetratricopeptide (TPR) repeat protein